MRSTLLSTFVAVLIITSPCGAGTEESGNHSDPRFNRETPIVLAVRKVRPSIVAIKVEKTDNWNQLKTSFGTGVIIDERGYVVTNRHVISGAARITVELFDKTLTSAQVFAEDSRNDLAILKLPSTKKLQALTFAPGSDLMGGETVIAVGHPYGYRNTVSTGIISALDREVDVDGGPKLTNLIQTSAPINPGNSGGPLLNINGELIGIVVAMRNGAQGIAFALNADNVQVLLAQHLSAGRIAHVGHGLTCKENLAEGVVRQQVVVEKVASQSPAAAAGLKRGDVVVKVANRSVTNRFDLERSLWSYKAGDKVETTIVREGRVTSVALTLAQGDGRQVGALPEAEQPSRGDGSLVAVSHQVNSLLGKYQPATVEILIAVGSVLARTAR